MPTPECFKGLRKTFLEGQREGYKKAVANNTKGDFVMDVTRRFLKRFPPGLKDDEEPTPAHLASVDDALPDEERECPDPTDYPEDQPRYDRLAAEYEAVTKCIETRTKQITRWFQSRLNKDDSSKADGKPVLKQSKEPDLNDPLTILSLRLLGESATRPRKPTDFNVWAKDNTAAVNKEYTKEAGVNAGRNNLKLRGRIAQKLFSQQSDAVKKAYRQRAEELHKIKLAKFEQAMNHSASTTPESRQVCINGIASFAQPLLDLIVDHTGMVATLIIGGPEPAAGGRLNIIGLHSGGTKGPVCLTFAEAESERYHNIVIPVFSDFLRKCYTREDCQARALPSLTQSQLSCLNASQATYVRAAGDVYGGDNATSTSAAAPLATSSDSSVPGTLQQKDSGHRIEELIGTDASNVEAEKSSGGRAKRQTRRPGVKVDSSFQAGPATATHATERQQEPVTAPRSHVPSSPLFDTQDNPFASSPCAPVPPPRSHVPSSLLFNTQDNLFASSPCTLATPPGAHVPSSPLFNTQDNPFAPSPRAPVIINFPSQGRLADSELSSPHSSQAEEDTQSLGRDISSSRPASAGRALTRRSMFESTATASSAIKSLSSLSRGINVPKDLQSVEPKVPGRENRRLETSNVSEKKNMTPARKRKVASTANDREVKRRKVVAAEAPSKKVKSSSVSSRMQALAATSITARYLSTPDLFTLLPESCDSSFRNTLKMLNSVSWGMQWDLLTVEWLRFEAIYDFQGTSKLKSYGRPPAIGQWIKRARAPGYMPPIDVKKFQVDFWTWWADLQPDWRTVEDGLAERHDGGTFEALDTPGPNGWPSIVVALYFWGVALGDNRPSCDSWAVAVDDATWVLTQICHSHSD